MISALKLLMVLIFLVQCRNMKRCKVSLQRKALKYSGTTDFELVRDSVCVGSIDI